MNECVMKPIISISVLSKISLNLEVYNFLLNIERIQRWACGVQEILSLKELRKRGFLTQDVSKCENILEMKKNKVFSFFVRKQVN